jgi:hypothetical protein
MNAMVYNDLRGCFQGHNFQNPAWGLCPPSTNTLIKVAISSSNVVLLNLEGSGRVRVEGGEFEFAGDKEEQRF